ncbi:hypothetical protein TUM4438_10670 [Shewanella sairae]|uniref:DUF1640 domain-containing protein n=1 Tax=Shewanella sairae TaxID=190310 RepID=A0ABQ4P622_9GAMM|nr:hypothetical protein [Shewanella sairae]MCL1130500.1 hypothetical protein [Shewanella sairae]GIU42933.1 hypothetical protein TUM4438_10670 [Shewanella sairae]
MSDSEALTQKEVMQLLLNVAQHSVTREELTSARLELKQDIIELKTELKQDMSELKAELKQDISELKQSVVELRAELKQDNVELRAELKQDNAELRAEHKSVVKMLYSIQWLIVAAVVSFYLKDSVFEWMSALTN